MSSLNITLVQTDLHWEDKSANLQMLEEKLSNYDKSGHIIILPEMFTTGFSMNPTALAERMDGASVTWMKRMAIQKKSILTGSVIIEEEDAAGRKKFFNRMIWMMPNEQFGCYDKRHLFGFAGEDMHYTAGEKRKIFSVNGWKILPQICYDLRFPVWSRQQITKNEHECIPEYDLIIYVANWPEKRKHAWRSLLIARAIENQCYVIGVNRIGIDGNNNNHSGNSMVISPLGEIIIEHESTASIETVSLSKSTLDESRNKFPFLRDADSFQLIRD
jgi:predicted amidohydrolase